MRRARIDANHVAIREALRSCGWLVHDCHGLPSWCDLTAYHPTRGAYALVEVKTEKGKLKPSQKQLVADGWPIVFLRSVDEAMAL